MKTYNITINKGTMNELNEYHDSFDVVKNRIEFHSKMHNQIELKKWDDETGMYKVINTYMNMNDIERKEFEKHLLQRKIRVECDDYMLFNNLTIMTNDDIDRIANETRKNIKFTVDDEDFESIKHLVKWYYGI